jgi:hypothetical protein
MAEASTAVSAVAGTAVDGVVDGVGAAAGGIHAIPMAVDTAIRILTATHTIRTELGFYETSNKVSLPGTSGEGFRGRMDRPANGSSIRFVL